MLIPSSARTASPSLQDTRAAAAPSPPHKAPPTERPAPWHDLGTWLPKTPPFHPPPPPPPPSHRDRDSSPGESPLPLLPLPPPHIFLSSPPGVPPGGPSDPNAPSESDDEIAWLAILLLSTVLIITLASVIRACGQKAGWLTGSVSDSSSSSGRSGTHGSGSRGRARGRGFYSGSGTPHVPEGETDPDETDERLAALTDSERQAYEVAKAFQLAYPPGSVPTNISLSQYLSIQEKGVSAWEFEASYEHRLFVHDRTEISFSEGEACVQTNLPLPKQQEVYYWEVKMFEKSPNTNVAVGVSTKPYPTSRLPGWSRHSVGYFSKDGYKYCNSPWSGLPCGPSYFEGDVIGCGYRPRYGTVFFTRNGKRIEDAYTGYRTNLFPTVGATGPCVLHVNFGQSGFVFVEANVKKWGLAPASGSLAPPPAYGSELGSILLEAGSTQRTRSNYSGAQSSHSRSRMSSGTVQGATRGSIEEGQNSAPSSRRQGRQQQQPPPQQQQQPQQQHTYQNGTHPAPVDIPLLGTSAPPPNYSSVDRTGSSHLDSRPVHGPEEQQSETSGHGRSMSQESATFLLGDALPNAEEDERQEGVR